MLVKCCYFLILLELSHLSSCFRLSSYMLPTRCRDEGLAVFDPAEKARLSKRRLGLPHVGVFLLRLEGGFDVWTETAEPEDISLQNSRSARAVRKAAR